MRRKKEKKKEKEKEKKKSKKKKKEEMIRYLDKEDVVTVKDMLQNE